MRIRPTLLLPSGDRCHRLMNFRRTEQVFVSLAVCLVALFSSTANGIPTAYGRGVGQRRLSRNPAPPTPKCNLDIISVRRQDQVKDGFQLNKALYHTGWFGGLEHVSWCHKYGPTEAYPADQLPPIEIKACKETMALQGRIMNPVNLPIKDATKQFFSCMDSRAAYAGLGTPGGDMGEFINTLAAAENSIGYPFTHDDVFHFLKKYLEDMVASGKGYFSMCSDAKAVKTWFDAAKIQGTGAGLQRWNPLDTDGRRRLLRLATAPAHIGCAHLRSLVEKPNGYQKKIRKELVEAAILAYYAIYFDPFDPMRQHLLHPVMGGEQKPAAVLNVQQPLSCRPLAPLVVPKIHTQTPTEGGEILKTKFLSIAENKRLRGDDEKEKADGKGDQTTGSEVLVYHFVAVADHRRMLVNYFAPKFGLNFDVLLAKVNNLGQAGFTQLSKKLAPGKPHYIVSFFPENKGDYPE